MNKPGILIFILFSLYALKVNGQQITNIKAEYKSDTLFIHYEITGILNLDSLLIRVVAEKSLKTYDLFISNARDSALVPGKDKPLYLILPRDSFPDEGESLRIQLTGWTKAFKVKRKRSPGQFFETFYKETVFPRFTISCNKGWIFRSRSFSEIGHVSCLSLNYNPAEGLQTGFGMSYYYFDDSVNHFITYPAFVHAMYRFPSAVYFMMNWGYSYENSGSSFTFGLGYKNMLWGPFDFELGAQYHQFYGSRYISALSINAGLSMNFSSRKRYKKEKVYRFARDFLYYAETGLNYLNKPGASFSFEIAYPFSPYYSLGLGGSFESVNYRFLIDYEYEYYSTYYNRYIPVVESNIPVQLGLNIVPLYITGRLFFTGSKLRPYLQWKYGATVFCSSDKGKIKNGFVADLGLGIQYPINKKTGFIFNFGIKYFENELSGKAYFHDRFGTFFMKTGVVF